MAERKYNLHTALVDSSEIRKKLAECIPLRSHLEAYRPSLEWFSRKEDIGPIHGIGHEARVLLLQEVLSTLLLQKAPNLMIDREALRWAAVTHDTKRLSDGDDLDHGTRSALFANNILNDQVPSSTLNLISFLNFWHVPYDTDAPVLIPELKIFKDADALDRVRSQDLDPNQLRLRYSKRLILPSELLFERSLFFESLGREPFNAAMDAGVEIGILQDK